MRKGFLSIALVFLCWTLPGQVLERPNIHQVKITSSWFAIHGATNVNNFHCGLNQSAFGDSIVVRNIWSNQRLDFENFRLEYKVSDFECGNRLMNEDFQELLRVDEHPRLVLEVNAILLDPNNDAFEELEVDALVEVRLAGISKEINIEGGKVYNHSPAHLTLAGRKPLLMSDFEVSPPTKFLGMIKVKDDIEIEFELSMEVSTYQEFE